MENKHMFCGVLSLAENFFNFSNEAGKRGRNCWLSHSAVAHTSLVPQQPHYVSNFELICGVEWLLLKHQGAQKQIASAFPQFSKAVLQLRYVSLSGWG